MSSQIRIRPVKSEDYSSILELYSIYVKDTSFTFETEVPDLDEFSERIENINKEAPYFVCEDNSRFVGYAYAGKHRTRAAYDYSRELSVYIHNEYKGKNIAKGLYTTVIELLKQQGFANTLAGITIPNPDSERFHQKFGFSKVGVYHNVGFKHGHYHDVGWWELNIRNSAPGKILAYDQLTPNQILSAIQIGENQINTRSQ